MEKHSFHIPVMGIGYTADSPLKVAVYGIDSVISLVDDILLEKLRKYHSLKNDISYMEITSNVFDYRALRITKYLDTIHHLIQDKITKLKNTNTLKCHRVKDFIKHLPDTSELKLRLNNSNDIEEIRGLIRQNLKPGSIDVNIMTKVDKVNFGNDGVLPIEYNDAHAALRGFANSKISSSVVFSAGLNPKLYNYLESFDDFYPDKDGIFKKKIILKVSDYRSAIVQGKYLAKKGLWVSEYRIESDLNCGGHAFATNGYLIGPVLEEFKQNKEHLYHTTYELYSNALLKKLKNNTLLPELKITAQGGVGTYKEHQFLLEHYQLNSVGWGSPFLLVPEVTSVDQNTLNQLADTNEKDLYLSDISPLGVRFNNLKGNTKDLKKAENIHKNRPGSACPKKHVALNTEFKKEGLCTASIEYQYLKINQINGDIKLNANQKKAQINKITEKSCICVGLGTSALLKYDIETKKEGDGVSVCPGPNLAYFNKKISLSRMTDHIYGKTNIISVKNRPNMFLKELSMYLDYFVEQIKGINNDSTPQQTKVLISFSNNLLKGIKYYQNLFRDQWFKLVENHSDVLNELSNKYLQVIRLQTQLQQK
ncbi:hypothetical protein ACXGQW_11285 [Wenyingzhuangia sp. IMCC45533]